jgi:hypothetical protein
MHRHILIGTFLGVSLLSAGCSDESTAPEKNTYPRPKVATVEPEEPSSYVTGFAHDPEAFFLNLVACGGPACPFPPFLLDASPVYLSSVLRNAPITLLDPAINQPAVMPALSNVEGTWTLPTVKNRVDPYLPLAAAEGAQLATGVPSPVPMADIPPATYLPTVTLRPVSPLASQCIGIEAIHTSDNGVLEAVAKYLTFVEGVPTTVADFLTPTRYSGVNVFWLYIPGFPFLRAPTTPPPSPTPPPNPLAVPNTTVNIAVGLPSSRIFNIQWAPKEMLPPEVQALQSARGFFVLPGLESSNVGIVVALHDANTPPGSLVVYQVEDKVTDEETFRPWKTFPIPAPVAPGAVVAASLQLSFNDAPDAVGPLPPYFCLPPPPPAP